MKGNHLHPSHHYNNYNHTGGQDNNASFALLLLAGGATVLFCVIKMIQEKFKNVEPPMLPGEARNIGLPTYEDIEDLPPSYDSIQNNNSTL